MAPRTLTDMERACLRFLASRVAGCSSPNRLPWQEAMLADLRERKMVRREVWQGRVVTWHITPAGRRELAP